MPKLKASHYAKALYEALKESKEEKERKKIFKNFLKLLQLNNDLRLAENILEEFKKILFSQEGILEIEIITRYPLEKKEKDKIKTKLKKTFTLKGFKDIKLLEKVDSNLLGGMVLRYNDVLIDASLKKILKDLRKKLLT